jgi:hypothetical protein
MIIRGLFLTRLRGFGKRSPCLAVLALLLETSRIMS